VTARVRQGNAHGPGGRGGSASSCKGLPCQHFTSGVSRFTSVEIRLTPNEGIKVLLQAGAMHPTSVRLPQTFVERPERWT
jgi:hypothetical protein